MEEVDGLGAGVLDEHAAGIAVDQRGDGFVELVGEQQDGLVVADVGDSDLADLAGIVGQAEALVEGAGVAVAAADIVEFDAVPEVLGGGAHGLEDLLGAAAESEEVDGEFLQAGEVGVGGEGGIKDEFAGVVAEALVPVVGEAEDLVVVVLLANAGVGVAEDAGFGIAGDEGEDAFLAAAALGDVVFGDEGVVAVIGDGVEVEVEGVAAGQAQVVDGVEPAVGEGLVLAGVDAAGVCGEGGALGNGIEAGEEGEAGVASFGGDMGLAGEAVELEGEQGEEGAVGGDGGAGGQAGLGSDAGEGDGCEQLGEEEETAAGGVEAAGGEVEFTAVGNGGEEGAGGEELGGGAAGQLGAAGMLEDASDGRTCWWGSRRGRAGRRFRGRRVRSRGAERGCGGCARRSRGADGRACGRGWEGRKKSRSGRMRRSRQRLRKDWRE